jgi:phospholipid/cholesterol/gamma-HCH transport system substrate-binding protein
MSEQALRFRIGLFVVAAVGLLIALIAMFGAVPALFTGANRYVVVLPNAEKVTPGTPVRRSGVRIGEVRKVELDDETGKVNVTLEVGRKHTLRQHEQPVLTRTVLGDPAIDFLPRPLAPGKEPDRSPIQPGAVLEGTQQLDVPASLSELHKAAENFNRLVPRMDRTLGEAQVAVGNWGRVGERVETLLKTGLEEKLLKTIDNVNTTVSRVGDVFGPENQRNLTVTLKNVRTASDSLDSLTKNTDELLKEGRGTLKQINSSLGKTDQLLTNMEKATRPLADRSETLTKNLDESAARLNRILANLEELLQQVTKGDGTVKRLLTDPSLYNNLNTAACGIARMMPQLERILKDVEIFADKIARHPEALGVGGVVRPGSGLK